MQILPYEQRYAEKIAVLLNHYLPFEEETADTVEQASGIQLLCVDNDEVIGYIAGYRIESFKADFPYFDEQLMKVQQIVDAGETYYTSHFVVNPNFRNRGIGTRLVQAYMEHVQQVAQSVIVVGWVQSDIGKWTAQKQFMQQGFQSIIYIDRYFEPYDVYCPNCAGTCYCDAHIVAKSF